MVVTCEQMWREISNYLDNEVEPALRSAMEEHLRGCKCCTAVLQGTRNVVELYGDERMLQTPLGFSRRLHRRLEGDMAGTRRSFMGWLVAAAAAILVFGGFEVSRSSTFSTPLRSEHAESASDVPPDLKVVVTEDGKTFHVPGCEFIHDKSHLRTILASVAVQAGYSPCVRCMKKYLPTLKASNQVENTEDWARLKDVFSSRRRWWKGA